MTKMKASFIGIVRPQPEDLWPTLEKIAAIGYKATENAWSYCNTPGASFEDNLKHLKDIGLEPVDVAAFNGEDLKTRGAHAIIENAHKLGVDKATMFHGAAYYAKGGKVVTYDEVMEEIEMLQNVAAECKKEGVKFAYHNHDHEFTTYFNGMTVFDMLLAYAPDLWLELDVGWVTYAGYDPVKLLDRVKDRVALMHFKDYLPDSPVKHTVPMLDRTLTKTYDMPNFCSLGSGVLKVHDCLKKCAEIGIDVINVEQDFNHVLDPLEILQVDYLVMKESGLVE
ncbi:MAG: sugar phosphate isomerase/epimerase [Solobacterium sp.]|nr:sugar phosphate isomerase/epimerase [Solobacterium sp.]